MPKKKSGGAKKAAAAAPAGKAGGARKRGQNIQISKGLYKYSRASVARSRGAYKLGGGGRPFPVVKAKAKPAAAPAKAGKFYATEDTPVPKKSNKSKRNQTKLKASIKPGSILILLAGPQAGKRVVFLKQLASGLLCVTGPFSLNGCPVRRVNQTYVIGTSTAINVSGVDAKKFDDAYFTKVAAERKSKSEADFGDQAEKAPEVSAERKADQVALDAAVVKAIGGGDMEAYLKAKFYLTNGQYPHLMKF
jgi:large subunit ribosomal protein L6e